MLCKTGDIELDVLNVLFLWCLCVINVLGEMCLLADSGDACEEDTVLCGDASDADTS